MKSCSTCGRQQFSIRDDGECFACHVRGIGFTFVGGSGYGRQAFHDCTTSEFIDKHVGVDNIRNGTAERVR